ncbi:hypothetical protein [Aeromicrobium sp. Leaf291]|uniref:hypothetical protein n=1 Tax=Aeromicrobium sp. Leaf291 TaxID=1736325 RepID=UPI0006F417B9|nr:hypothetical protein [Aeromicrobium sp. Leaf291]KQP83940.1 hypothetical protein ASF35_03005 [Aeromicrobium sp. Leaf291]
MKKRWLTAFAVSVLSLPALGSFSGPASAAAWPAGCKVTLTPSGTSTTVQGVCPSNRHKALAVCRTNTGVIAYKESRIAGVGQTSLTGCFGNDRLLKADIKVY